MEQILLKKSKRIINSSFNDSPNLIHKTDDITLTENVDKKGDEALLACSVIVKLLSLKLILGKIIN